MTQWTLRSDRRAWLVPARRALDAAVDAMMIVDGFGVVRLVNRQVVALVGYSPEEFSGERLGH